MKKEMTQKCNGGKSEGDSGFPNHKRRFRHVPNTKAELMTTEHDDARTFLCIFQEVVSTRGDFSNGKLPLQKRKIKKKKIPSKVRMSEFLP